MVIKVPPWCGVLTVDEAVQTAEAYIGNICPCLQPKISLKKIKILLLNSFEVSISFQIPSSVLSLVDSFHLFYHIYAHSVHCHLEGKDYILFFPTLRFSLGCSWVSAERWYDSSIYHKAYPRTWPLLLARGFFQQLPNQGPQAGGQQRAALPVSFGLRVPY